MRTVAVLVALLAAVVLAVANQHAEDEILFATFAQFEATYEKNYATLEERVKRFNAFKENLAIIEKLNAANGNPAFGITKFMDLTAEEFRQQYLLPFPINVEELPSAPQVTVPMVDPRTIPTTFDWRNESGIVTPVKNQASCGSCWAFSATEQIESVAARAGKGLLELAPQQMVDCDTACYGCRGGWTEKAYAYIIKAGGQALESDYAYTAKNGKCVYNDSIKAVSLKSWSYVSQKAADEESVMLPFVYSTAPVSICVDATTWQHYTGGVLKTCGTRLNHCVQITGFSQVAGEDVWLIRNSWGTSWGEAGFIYVPRGKNMCGLATDATTVTIA